MLFTDIESVLLHQNLASSLQFFGGAVDESDIGTRLRRFCDLCQFVEYYCLFEDIYVDFDNDLFKLHPATHDIFSHPKVASENHPLLNLQYLPEYAEL